MRNLKITKDKNGRTQILIDGINILDSLCVKDLQINIDASNKEAIFTVPIMGDIEIDDCDIFMQKIETTETETLKNNGEVNIKIRIKKEIVTNKIPFKVAQS